MKLIATFAATVKHLTYVRDEMDTRTSTVSLIDFVPSGEHTIATGPAQDIMFLIGEVANYGDATLVSAQRA